MSPLNCKGTIHQHTRFQIRTINHMSLQDGNIGLNKCYTYQKECCRVLTRYLYSIAIQLAFLFDNMKKRFLKYLFHCAMINMYNIIDKQIISIFDEMNKKRCLSAYFLFAVSKYYFMIIC